MQRQGSDRGSIDGPISLLTSSRGVLAQGWRMERAGVVDLQTPGTPNQLHLEIMPMSARKPWPYLSNLCPLLLLPFTCPNSIEPLPCTRAQYLFIAPVGTLDLFQATQPDSVDMTSTEETKFPEGTTPIDSKERVVDDGNLPDLVDEHEYIGGVKLILVLGALTVVYILIMLDNTILATVCAVPLCPPL
jgi:hypothetical protein